jgi:hypothetical protein
LPDANRMSLLRDLCENPGMRSRAASTSLDTVTLRLRRIALDDLSPLGQRVFRYAFPIFDEKPSLSSWAQGAHERGETVERPFNYRRYAAGPELPRGCYATICPEGQMSDAGTLAGELVAYGDPRQVGEYYIFDGSDPRVTGEDPRMLGECPGYRPAPTSIVVAFASRPTRLHPLLDPNENALGDFAASEQFRSFAPISDRLIALFEIPTKIETVELSKVIDLRKPAQQQWLLEVARSGLFLTAFLYPAAIPGAPRIDLKSFVPQGFPLKMQYVSPRYEQNPSGLRKAQGSDGPPGLFASTALCPERMPETFTDLLPFLMTPGRGGSPVTEALGATFRARGARGLIYPSARTDVECVIRDGELVRERGWCFVDYSTFEVPRAAYRAIIDPVGWCSREQVDLYVRPPDHPEAGSWKLTGIREREERGHMRETEAFYARPPAKVPRILRRARRTLRSVLGLEPTASAERVSRTLGMLPGFDAAVAEAKKTHPGAASAVWETIASMRLREAPRRVSARLVQELVPQAERVLAARPGEPSC